MELIQDNLSKVAVNTKDIVFIKMKTIQEENDKPGNNKFDKDIKKSKSSSSDGSLVVDTTPLDNSKGPSKFKFDN